MSFLKDEGGDMGTFFFGLGIVLMVLAILGIGAMLYFGYGLYLLGSIIVGIIGFGIYIMAKSR